MESTNNSPIKNRKILESLFRKNGYADFKWINPKEIVVSQWVRMKCMFGCNSYGRNASCPPNVPSVVECRQFFNEYETVVIFHFQKKVKSPKERREWVRTTDFNLLKLEREVFLSGYHKAFLLFMDHCRVCEECAGMRDKCRSPLSARPPPESLGVDVFETARKYGYPIEVLTDYSQTMNRYAFLLIE